MVPQKDRKHNCKEKFMGSPQIPVQVLHRATNMSAFPAYVSFSAEIAPFTTESLIALLANLSNQGVKEVYLMLSTLGGSVMHGMNLYNVLRAFPFKLTTHNVGNVDSIGNAVFLAGEQRYACPHSTFMFHGVASKLPQMNAEAKFLRERLDSITSDIKRIGDILVERTGISQDQVSNLFGEAQTKDATFAVGCGIVHEVRDVKIPVGASIFSLVFQR
jgi:ATP-dependent Clp protease, protease subunit